MSTWREKAEKVIRQVVKDNPDVPEKEMTRLLREAYCFGMRQYYPYQAWLKAQKQALDELYRPAPPPVPPKPVDIMTLPLFRKPDGAQICQKCGKGKTTADLPDECWCDAEVKI